MNAITALAHYEAMAEQARTVDFARIAARLSNATTVPTLEDLHAIVGAVCGLVARATTPDDARNCGWLSVASESIDWAHDQIGEAIKRQPVSNDDGPDDLYYQFGVIEGERA